MGKSLGAHAAGNPEGQELGPQSMMLLRQQVRVAPFHGCHNNLKSHRGLGFELRSADSKSHLFESLHCIPMPIPWA